MHRDESKSGSHHGSVPKGDKDISKLIEALDAALAKSSSDSTTKPRTKPKSNSKSPTFHQLAYFPTTLGTTSASADNVDDTRRVTPTRKSVSSGVGEQLFRIELLENGAS